MSRVKSILPELGGSTARSRAASRLIPANRGKARVMEKGTGGYTGGREFISASRGFRNRPRRLAARALLTHNLNRNLNLTRISRPRYAAARPRAGLRLRLRVRLRRQQPVVFTLSPARILVTLPRLA